MGIGDKLRDSSGSQKVPNLGSEAAKPVFSITSDIFLYRRCSRQYGFVKVRGYPDEAGSQAFIGDLVHNTMEDVTLHLGRMGTEPTDSEVAEIMIKHYNTLRSQGATPRDWDALKSIGCKVMVLVRTMSVHGILKQINSAEQTLLSDQGKHIFQGRVDAVYDTSSGDFEVWDYKSARDPREFLQKLSPKNPVYSIWQRYLADNEAQLQLYTHLFETTYHKKPTSAKLMFIPNIPLTAPVPLKLKVEDTWRQYIPPPIAKSVWESFHTPKEMGAAGTGPIFSIPVSMKDIKVAMVELKKTANEILNQRLGDSWPVPSAALRPDKEKTCDVCAVRSTCPGYP